MKFLLLWVIKFVFKNSIFFLFLSFIVLGCGGNKKSKKEKFAKKIAHESCKDISNFSKTLIGGIISSVFNELTGSYQGIDTGTLGELPANWCDCYSYFVTKDLSERFTEKELMEIYRDKVKRVMVIEKILETRQEEMKRCIEETTNEIAKDYDKFAKELDGKFK